MIGIVIPVHNEQDYLRACLASVQLAMAHPGLPAEEVRVLAVLDACSDGSGGIAQGMNVEFLAIDSRNVGLARATGAAALMQAGARWLAFTDADSVVAPAWLATQLALAVQEDADAVCGTVAVADWSVHGERASFLQRHFQSTYFDQDQHRHIHGANRGVSTVAYRRAGGFGTKCATCWPRSSSSRAKGGSTPSETATFVFSLKQPLFARLNAGFANDPAGLANATWTISTLLDKLGLYTIEVFQRTRDQIIVRQQQELLELSTPVVKLWNGILALPLIGTLDSARTQVVMENILQKIVDTGAGHRDHRHHRRADRRHPGGAAPDEDHRRRRLMGADCIISGIRPQIAQTIVHLGVNLEDVMTKATLADAFLVALERTGAVDHAKKG
jgi:anti-anti-sigma regulatory factor